MLITKIMVALGWHEHKLGNGRVWGMKVAWEKSDNPKGHPHI